MKRFIQFLLVSLAMLVGMSVSFATAPEIKKLPPEKQGYTILIEQGNDIVFTQHMLALPPGIWQGLTSQVVHNTPYLLNKNPYLLNKNYLNNRPLGKSGKFIFTRGFDL